MQGTTTLNTRAWQISSAEDDKHVRTTWGERKDCTLTPTAVTAHTRLITDDARIISVPARGRHHQGYVGAADVQLQQPRMQTTELEQSVALCTAVLCPPGVTCLSCTHHVYDTNLFCFGAKEKGNQVKLRCMTINKPVNHADLSWAHFYPREGSHCTNPSIINVKNGF